MVRMTYSVIRIVLYVRLCHTCLPAVSFTDWKLTSSRVQTSDLNSAKGALNSDYSNKETTSVSLKLSNFAI